MIKPQQFYIFARIFLAVGYYLLIAFPLVVSAAAQVTLEWNENDTTPDGYNLYQRADGHTYDYSNPVNQTPITATTYTVGDLETENTYYFVVRAFLGDQESGNSNEVEYVAPAVVLDSDNDGYNDAIDAFDSDPTEWLDTDNDGVGNNADTDDDGDGMPDIWEALYGLDPLAIDADDDLDGDGVSNIDEYNSGSNPSQAPANAAPDRPILAEPVDGATGVEVMPILMTEAFIDTDLDTHARTQYQIALNSNWDNLESADFVFDHESAQYLTSLPLGELILDPETTYYWRVRFYDEHNGASEWSATGQFTTTDNLIAGLADDDGDGILNEQEVANESIDPDLNATADMMVIGSSDAFNPQLALLFSSSADVMSVRTVDAENVELGSAANRPEIMTGLLSFKLRLQGAETSTSLTIYLSEPAPEDAVWYKYSIEDGWIPYPDYQQKVSFSVDRKSVTIHMVDGGEEDDDGVRNGVIVDPSGLGYRASDALGYSSQISDVSSTSDSSGAGCFISATSSGELRFDAIILVWMVLSAILGLVLRATRKEGRAKHF